MPDQVLELSRRLRGQYSGYSGPVMEQVEAASERGEQEMDAVYRLPPSAAADAAESARMLGAMWDAVDEFCREGQMLSLETPPEAKLFRRWFLEQFINQVEGADPVPWPEAADSQNCFGPARPAPRS